MQDLKYMFKRGKTLYNIESGDLIITDKNDKGFTYGYMLANIPLTEAKTIIAKHRIKNLDEYALGFVSSSGKKISMKFVSNDCFKDLLNSVLHENGWGDDSKDRITEA